MAKKTVKICNKSHQVGTPVTAAKRLSCHIRNPEGSYRIYPVDEGTVGHIKSIASNREGHIEWKYFTVLFPDSGAEFVLSEWMADTYFNTTA